jgi:hypothetical protein
MDEFETLGRNLEEAFGQIKSATPAYFDVNIKSLADTQDYLGQYGNTARDPDALRQEFYGFKPAQESVFASGKASLFHTIEKIKDQIRLEEIRLEEKSQKELTD